MPKCNTQGCNNPAANDCEHSECGACCQGCSRHLSRCEGCEERIDECLCEECNRCDDCCDCEVCPNCGSKNFESLCDHLQDYCDICDGLENVAFGIGYVCDGCATGLAIGGQDNGGY